MEFIPYPGITYRHDYPTIFGKLSRLGDSAKSRQKKLSVYRELCRTDLFFLAYWGLGLTFMHSSWNVAKWYVDRCNEIDDGPDTNTLDLWGRELGKSTLNTYVRIIQEILRDPAIRIGLFCYNRPLAKDFLSIFQETLKGDLMAKRWFPDIFYDKPKTQAPSWSLEYGLVVKGHGGQKESTIEAWGITDGQPTGRHFDLLVYDDIITVDMKDSPTLLAKASDRWRMSLNLGSSVETPVRKWVSGTRYDHSDLYGEIIEGKTNATEFNDWVIRIWPGEDERHGDTVYHCFDAEYYAAKREEMGSSVYAAQVLQNPNDPKQQFFKRGYIKYWTALPKDVMDWYKVTFCDPAGWEEHAKGDNTAIVTVGRQPETGENWILEIESGRWRPRETISRLYEAKAKWNPDKMGIEDEKYGKSILDTIETELADRGPIRVDAIGSKNIPKPARIETLQSPWEAGLIRLHPMQDQARQEFLRYPGWKRKDEIDSIAYAIKMMPVKSSVKRRRRRRRSQPYSHSRFGPC